MIKKGRIIMNTVGKKMLSAEKMNRFSHKVMSTDRSSSSQCKSSEKKEQPLFLVFRVQYINSRI